MSVTRRERSMNLSVSLKELEFNEEYFSRTPIEPCRDRGSRIEIELEELNSYARVLTNLKNRLIIPIQDIILACTSETPGLKCVKRICSHLIVVEETVIKFHKYSGLYFKNTESYEERRIFINCASCLSAIIRAWEEYLLAYAEADAFEAFEEVTKLPEANTIIECGYAEFSKFCHISENFSHKVNNHKKLSLKLSHLLLIIHDERASIVVLSNELSISVGAHMEKDESDFKMSCDKLARLTERKRNLQNQVEVTRKFWNEHTKLLNCSEVKNMKKLIILSSKERKLTYTKWGSINTVGFVLFQDSLLKFTIDFMGNYESQVLPLNALWVYASKSKPESRLLIQLIAPEAHLFLQCNNQDDRDYWVRAINEATIDYLGVPRQEVISKPFQASSLLWPPPLRNATYLFKSGQYLGAKYSGMWTDGRQHGRGSCIWPDGKTYMGQFRKGFFHGKGKLCVPYNTENEGIYEGQFEEGLFHGYGVLNYANQDHYEGEWYKGQRHGHGKFVITRDNQYSMYIGEWASGKRNGFGVENATDAEKSYHGMWKDDIREGQGFTITTGDLYCSCRFRDNVLSGRGFIINGAGKIYEGWLSGAMGLNGTGELRLPDNTVISGTFSGRWSDWVGTSHELKIANGFISKHEVSRKAKRFDFIEWEEKAMKYSASPEYKWASLFEKCKVVLHLVDKDPELLPSLNRNKSRRKSNDQDNLNGFNRRSTTMNNGRTPLRKCDTPLTSQSQNGIVKPNKNSFEIAVGPLSPVVPSTPVNSFDIQCVYGRERSRSNPEGCRQLQTTPPSRPKFIRTNSLRSGLEASEAIKSECTTPNQFKRTSPITDKETSSDFNSASLSSSVIHECVYMGSINEVKKSLFDKVNMYFSSHTHALGKLVRDLKDVIFESYAGIGASQYLLPHAINDTKTFLEKLAEIIQKFAPFMMDNDSDFLEENIHIIDSYFISDLFISRIYHTLFTLFSLFQAKNDTQYETTVAILSLMRCSDLMSLFQIESIPSDPHWYIEASYILSTISQEYTIQGKLDILKRSVNNMLDKLKDSSSEFTTDVIIPYFQTVIVYARVKKLSTELHYIYTFMHPNLSQGEFGFLLTLLEGCYMMLVPEKLPRL